MKHKLQYLSQTKSKTICRVVSLRKSAILLFAASIMFGVSSGLTSQSAQASTDAAVPPHFNWSFKGPLGTYDKASLQRGFQVYKEVCASCHSMHLLHYRNLSALGFNEDEVKAIAAQNTVIDGPNDQGDMFERPALPRDKFVSPFKNDQAARAANNGALPPDLSLITKARADGSNYVRALLLGYTDPPADVTIADGMHYNQYFPGYQIAMAQLIVDNAVSYSDGTPSTRDQIATDVVAFLTWAADPVMEQRNAIGFKSMVFLAAFAVIMYLVKRKVWSKLD